MNKQKWNPSTQSIILSPLETSSEPDLRTLSPIWEWERERIVDQSMAQIFEYFVVCGIGPEIRTLDGGRGFHGFGIMYLPSLLDQYPPANHTLYPPPPPQLPTVSITTTAFHLCFSSFWTVHPISVELQSDDSGFQCVLPAGVLFYSSGFDANDASTFPRSYPIVLTGMP